MLNKIHDDIMSILKYDKTKLSAYIVSLTNELNMILSILSKHNNNSQIIQLIEKDVCYSETQLKLAGILTLKSFSEKKNISSKPQIEYLLYLTATTQIKDAIKKAGVKNKEKACLVIVTAEDINHDLLLNTIINETKIVISAKKITPNPFIIREIYDIDPNIPEDLLESIILTKIAVLDAYK